MKAYKISDLKGYADYSTVVFAETSGKAKAIAITTDAFNDYEFTEISARRVPNLDKYYRGLDEKYTKSTKNLLAESGKKNARINIFTCHSGNAELQCIR